MLHMNALGSTPNQKKKKGLYSELRFAKCIFWVYEAEIKGFCMETNSCLNLGQWPSVFLLVRKQ